MSHPSDHEFIRHYLACILCNFCMDRKSAESCDYDLRVFGFITGWVLTSRKLINECCPFLSNSRKSIRTTWPVSGIRKGSHTHTYMFSMHCLNGCFPGVLGCHFLSYSEIVCIVLALTLRVFINTILPCLFSASLLCDFFWVHHCSTFGPVSMIFSCNVYKLGQTVSVYLFQSQSWLSTIEAVLWVLYYVFHCTFQCQLSDQDLSGNWLLGWWCVCTVLLCYMV